jgi:hypothetical protein
MAKSKKKNIKVRDLHPKKDAKGGGGFKPQSNKPQSSQLQGSSLQSSSVQSSGQAVS